MSTSLIRDSGETLTFDVTVNLATSGSLLVTSHPLEDGGVVSDHTQATNLPVMFRSLVTQSPLDSQLGDNPATGKERVDSALDFLDELQGELVTLESDGRVFENVVVTRWPSNHSQLEGATFEIEVQQIRIANSTTVDVPVQDRYQASARGGNDIGEQPTNTPNDATSADASTILAGLLGIGG